MYTLLFFLRFFYHFQCFINSVIHMNTKLDHMHIDPHGIRTKSKHQLRPEFGNLGHLVAEI